MNLQIFKSFGFVRLLICSQFFVSCGEQADRFLKPGASNESIDINLRSEHESLSDDATSDNSALALVESIDVLGIDSSIELGHFPVCSENVYKDENGYCPLSEEVHTEENIFVCTSQKYNLVKSPDKFIALNPFSDTLWPGSLIQTRALINGVLDPIPLQGRSESSITMTLASGSEGSFSAILDSPSLMSTTDGIKRILDENTDIATPAKFYYKMSRIFSQEQLSVSLGVNAYTPFDLDIFARFDMEERKQKNRVLLDFTQEYYTVAFTPENGIKSFLNEGTSVEDLKSYTSQGNPIAYISSVTYGRKLYFLFESDDSFTDIEAALEANFQGYGVSLGVELDTKYKKILRDSNIKVHVLGGSAEKSLDALNSYDELGSSKIDFQKLFTESANFSKENPGVPISYAVRHIKDASQIKSVISTEYTAKDCNPVSDYQAPSTWALKITLNDIKIDKENDFCEGIFDDMGEFSSCLQVRVGETGAIEDVFCSDEIRLKEAGEYIDYGDSNHSTIVEVDQVTGQKIYISGKVLEHDDESSDKILNFTNTYALSPQYEWLGWEEMQSVSGVKKGCMAKMTYSLEWIEKY